MKMKLFVLALVACSLALIATPVAAMHGKLPANPVPAGTDNVPRASYDALGVRLDCAKSKWAKVGATGQGVTQEAYDMAGMALDHHNQAEFDRYATSFNTDVTNMKLGCPVTYDPATGKVVTN